MAYLVLMTGTEKGLQYELPSEGRLSVGRAGDNSIVIEGPAISGHHCTIVIASGTYRLQDHGSTNGTRVNDEPVSEATLFRGDVITLGTTPLMLEGGDVPARDGDPSLGGGIDRSKPDIRPRTTRSQAPVPRPKDFGKRRDHSRHWKLVILVIGLIVFVALIVFTLQMFGN